MSNVPFYLEAISACLHSGQASAKKIDAQRALSGLRLALEADARALWAVRVLDLWQAKHTPLAECWHTTHTVNGRLDWFRCNVFRHAAKCERERVCFEDGPTPDAARIAAAKALVAEDPTLGEGL
jgi:hypothetical protein